jgi:hypothetical protein
MMRITRGSDDNASLDIHHHAYWFDRIHCVDAHRVQPLMDWFLQNIGWLWVVVTITYVVGLGVLTALWWWGIYRFVKWVMS